MANPLVAAGSGCVGNARPLHDEDRPLCLSPLPPPSNSPPPRISQPNSLFWPAQLDLMSQATSDLSQLTPGPTRCRAHSIYAYPPPFAMDAGGHGPRNDVAMELLQVRVRDAIEIGWLRN